MPVGQQQQTTAEEGGGAGAVTAPAEAPESSGGLEASSEEDPLDPTSSSTCFLCCMRFASPQACQMHQHHVHMRWVKRGLPDFANEDVQSECSRAALLCVADFLFMTKRIVEISQLHLGRGHCARRKTWFHVHLRMHHPVMPGKTHALSSCQAAVPSASSMVCGGCRHRFLTVELDLHALPDVQQPVDRKCTCLGLVLGKNVDSCVQFVPFSRSDSDGCHFLFFLTSLYRQVFRRHIFLLFGCQAVKRATFRSSRVPIVCFICVQATPKL